MIIIDTDPKWADSNAPWLRSLATRGLEVTIERAGAEAIPFPDAEFDFVTCQAVLIHVADPCASIAEMLRVLQPGGLFLCAEPDNFGTYAAASSLSGGSSLEEEAAALKFDLAQQRGHKALGYGDASLGGVLPGLLAASGLTDGHWSRELANRDRYLNAICDGRYHCAGGVLMYLVSGRK